MSEVLVIENSPADDIRRLGRWLEAAGVKREVVRAHAGDPLPESFEGIAGLVVLGGGQDAFGSPDGSGAPWFGALQDLLREAVAERIPTLGICLGAQLLALALGGCVQRSEAGFRRGPCLMRCRVAAASDPLFANLPQELAAISWHRDVIVDLPEDAVLLAGGGSQPHQAFRVGDRAWGLQPHIECDVEMIASWVAIGREPVPRPQELIEACGAAMDDIASAWRPFAERFAALVSRKTSGVPL